MTYDPIAFASHPVPSAIAMRLAFCLLAATAPIAVGKVVLAKAQEAPAAKHAVMALATRAADASLAIQIAAAEQTCRQAQIEVDDGYGVRGHVARWVCR